MSAIAKTIAPAPVRKTLRVNTDAQHAFDVFTGNITRWWPASHTMLKSPLKETIIEPFAEGRWYQVGADESQSQLGKVLAWEAPGRLLLAWQLDADWQFDGDLVTEIEVRFIAESEKTTRVEFEHRHLERMGDKAETARARIDAPNGWSAILESYRQSAEA